MKILWDEVKRIANLDKHGLDFADIIDIDWAHAVIESAKKDQHGRVRLKVIGYFRNGTAAAIFATIGTEAISVNSFRTANQKERRRLDEQNQTPN